MVYHRAADDESVAEMHTRHRSEGVHKVSAHPDRGCIVVADGVEEAVFGGSSRGGMQG